MPGARAQVKALAGVCFGANSARERAAEGRPLCQCPGRQTPTGGDVAHLTAPWKSHSFISLVPSGVSCVDPLPGNPRSPFGLILANELTAALASSPKIQRPPEPGEWWEGAETSPRSCGQALGISWFNQFGNGFGAERGSRASSLVQRKNITLGGQYTVPKGSLG